VAYHPESQPLLPWHTADQSTTETTTVEQTACSKAMQTAWVTPWPILIIAEKLYKEMKP
jgi:hypothetical protein